MKHGVLCFLNLHNPHISRCCSTARWQSYEKSKSNRRPPENEAVDARITFHLSGKGRGGEIKIIPRISMLKGKLPCLHTYSTFLNCFPYENKDKDWTGLFLLCPHLKWKTSWHVRKNSSPRIALSHNFPIACACLSLRMWQIGSRGAVVLVMASAVESWAGGGVFG